jgi:hypothetical protein
MLGGTIGGTCRDGLVIMTFSKTYCELDDGRWEFAENYSILPS